MRIPIAEGVDLARANLSVYHWDPDGEEGWVPLETTIDAGNRTAVATVESFSYLAVSTGGGGTGATRLDPEWPVLDDFTDLEGWSTAGNVSRERGVVRVESVEEEPAAAPPEIVSLEGPSSVEPGESGTFTVTVATNDSVTFEWTVEESRIRATAEEDTENGSRQNVTDSYEFSRSSEGNYRVEVTVEDSFGQTDTATTFVAVEEDGDGGGGGGDPAPPEITSLEGPSSLEPDESGKFTANVETSDSVEFEWTAWKTGIRSTDETGSEVDSQRTETGSYWFSASSEGQYRVKVTVEDSHGQTDTASTLVSVEEDDAPGGNPGQPGPIALGQGVEATSSALTRSTTLPAAATVEFHYRVRGETRGAPANASVVVQGASGETAVLELSGEGDRTWGWTSGSVDVSRFAGQAVTVQLRTEGNATLEADYVGFVVDSSGDGIPDEVARLDLELPAGPPGVWGTDLDIDPAVADTDGDGLADAETVWAEVDERNRFYHGCPDEERRPDSGPVWNR